MITRTFNFDLKTICNCLTEEHDDYFKIIGLQCLSNFHADKWILLIHFEEGYLIQTYSDKTLARHEYCADYAEALGRFQERINEFEPMKFTEDLEFERIAQEAEMDAQDFFADINAYFDEREREIYQDIENSYKEDYYPF